MKKMLLTLDVEEFDLPLQFNQKISEKEMYETSKKGLVLLLNLLDKYKIKATFFTTANFAKKYPKLIKSLILKKHEIASHGYSHSDSFQTIDQLKKAKKELEKITKFKIKGFRAPRFNIQNINILPGLGFKYDSSLHPTFIPGRYNNFFKSRQIHKIGKIIEIPPSTTPFVRLPLFWLAFKNLGINYAKQTTKFNFLDSKYTMLLFHPWEFTDISKFKVPNYIKKNNGKKLLKILENYILFCLKKGYEFDTVESYLENNKI
ncbi:MAG: polysaccharide deacetylase family protein [Nanoarchaeota archaeon]|nr:polysaccharide deacetylase family protein [Nanoarchaeota archaeon]MBU1028279.1 polysaccharide deacetylase family protein [Nanoarchaeota archaeon]